MAITLKHLCKYAKENYKMDQICGEGNMSNLVNWVHMLEDPETAYFLHGHELIFTTGIAPHDLEWFLVFAKGLVESEASGWVINIGPYIECVPEEVIDYCRQHDFPLFTIPWETRIVDITNDFCHKIIKAEENEVSLSGAFRNAIFFPNNSTQYRSVLEGKAFDLLGEFSILVIDMKVPAGKDVHTYEKVVRLHLSKILFGVSDKFAFIMHDRQLIVVLQDYDELAVRDAVDRLMKVCNYGGKKFRLTIGYSSPASGVESLKKSYKRAVDVQKLAYKKRQSYISYNDIGILQLLIEIDDLKVMERFYEQTLGVLEDYDDKHQSDYFYILKCYLDNNNSVEKVAKETYVHRNTINYKIKKIKEILGSDLNYEDGLKLMLAYHIKTLF